MGIYNALGVKTIQQYIDQLKSNAVFNALAQEQQIRCINAAVQEYNVLANEAELDDYKVDTLDAAGTLSFGKMYVTTLTQVGGNDPVAASPFVNMLPGTIVWTRVAPGSWADPTQPEYIGTLAGAFKTDGSTVVFMHDMTDVISLGVVDVNTVKIVVNNDGVLTNRRIDIVIM